MSRNWLIAVLLFLPATAALAADSSAVNGPKSPDAVKAIRAFQETSAKADDAFVRARDTARSALVADLKAAEDAAMKSGDAKSASAIESLIGQTAQPPADHGPTPADIRAAFAKKLADTTWTLPKKPSSITFEADGTILRIDGVKQRWMAVNQHSVVLFGDDTHVEYWTFDDDLAGYDAKEATLGYGAAVTQTKTPGSTDSSSAPPPPIARAALPAMNRHDLAVQVASRKHDTAIAAAAKIAIRQLESAQGRAKRSNDLNEADKIDIAVARLETFADPANHAIPGARLTAALIGTTWLDEGSDPAAPPIPRTFGRDETVRSPDGPANLHWLAITDQSVILIEGDRPDHLTVYHFDAASGKSKANFGNLEHDWSGKQLQ